MGRFLTADVTTGTVDIAHQTSSWPRAPQSLDTYYTHYVSIALNLLDVVLGYFWQLHVIAGKKYHNSCYFVVNLQ